MQKGQDLTFKCQSCRMPINFSVLDLKKQQNTLECSCGRCYAFSDITLRRQIEKFEALCRQISDSEEILSNTSVGVHVAGQEVKIPYRILLTRLNSRLDLQMDNEKISLEFSMEPRKDLYPGEE